METINFKVGIDASNPKLENMENPYAWLLALFASLWVQL